MDKLVRRVWLAYISNNDGGIYVMPMLIRLEIICRHKENDEPSIIRGKEEKGLIQNLKS